MTMRMRKLTGTVALLAFVLVYFLLAMEITARVLPELPLAVQLIGYSLAGLAWIIPAGWLIRWMSRPDA